MDIFKYWIRGKRSKKADLEDFFRFCFLKKHAQKRLYECLSWNYHTDVSNAVFALCGWTVWNTTFLCVEGSRWGKWNGFAMWKLSYTNIGCGTFTDDVSVVSEFAASLQNAGEPWAGMQCLGQDKKREKKPTVYRYKLDYAQPYVNKRENAQTLFV